MGNEFYDNRELSWLKFNERVLEEAKDETTPLFERLRFVQIFCSNLDEFFMIRVGSLHDKLLVDPKDRDNKTNMTPKEQLSAVAKKVAALLPQKDAIYAEIMRGLSEFGVRHISADLLTPEEDAYFKAYFNREIRPLLFTGIVDKKHSVPFLKNGEIYIGCKLAKKTESGKYTFGILPVPENLPRVVFLPPKKSSSAADEKNRPAGRFMLVEEIIHRFAKLVWGNFDIISKCIFRVTRNADIQIDEGLFDHDVDFRDIMSTLVKKRKKLSPVRVEFQGNPDSDTVGILSKILDVERAFVFCQNSPLTMGFLSTLEKRLENRAELFFEPLSPQRSPAVLPDVPMIRQIKKRDILLAYPYENINQFIRLLEEAADNPNVVSIKITLYRVARDSKIINALNKAAENGKNVLALVELRARFDEENNIGWSKQLEDAGVNVIYGLDDLKVHSKLLLITLREGNGVSYITQIGTGNYNERTSKLYTDLTLMTADKDIGTDASFVFNALMVGAPAGGTNKLLVAPKGLKNRIVEFIDNEITHGTDGYIGIKMNALTDRDLIEKLAEASRAGVQVKLIVRGICCLVPGVKGETENISVISIVGRFLEHSRIYIFGKDERRRVYISSADFMTRNTERRVEVAAPLLDKNIADRVCDIFNTMLMDNVKARVMGPDGLYRRAETGDKPLNSQLYFYDKAYTNARSAGNTAANSRMINSEPAAPVIPEENDTRSDTSETAVVKIRRVRNDVPVKVKIRRIK